MWDCQRLCMKNYWVLQKILHECFIEGLQLITLPPKSKAISFWKCLLSKPLKKLVRPYRLLRISNMSNGLLFNNIYQRPPSPAEIFLVSSLKMNTKRPDLLRRRRWCSCFILQDLTTPRPPKALILINHSFRSYYNHPFTLARDRSPQKNKPKNKCNFKRVD